MIDLARGLALTALGYGGLVLIGLIGLPAAWASERAARAVVRLGAGHVLLTARLLGIRVRLEGVLPTGPVIVAAQHQSFLDVLVLYRALPGARFVLKASLVRAPLFGFYARRHRSIAIDRGAGGNAAALRRASGEGPVVIFPEGTRRPPGAPGRIRRGVAVLAATLDRPVIPISTDAGRIWPARGLAKRAGIATYRVRPPLGSDGVLPALAAAYR